MSSPTPVVFVHGLWIHASAWQNWSEVFADNGFDPIAPGWPGEADSVQRSRDQADAMAGIGIEDITSAYAKIIQDLPAKPIVIGHSFGGLIAQKLLAQGQAAAAVAIDPAQIKGVTAVPFSQLRAGFPVLSRPGNKHRAVSLTAKQFRYGFGNALPEAESDELFERWSIPGPGRVLFESAAANLQKSSPARVDTTLQDRGPLLLIAGGRDHTAPEVLTRGTRRLYAKSPAITDYHVFPDRGHSLVLDHGWHEVADVVLNWVQQHR